MMKVPISSMSLFKHGVGFFTRRAKVEGEEVILLFKKEEMDDLLKSLTVINHGGGQVLGIDFDTPQSKDDKLENCSIILPEKSGFIELLESMRGRVLSLKLRKGTSLTGKLLGLNLSENKPLKNSLVSLFSQEQNMVTNVILSEIQFLTVVDEPASADLNFFLDTSIYSESHCSISIRLSPGSHDLEINYIAPAPLWSVSYRFVGGAKTESDTQKGLLQGWGIFHNSLEENLRDISISFVAGMPISFIYELYRKVTPVRPRVKEEVNIPQNPAGMMFDAAPEAEECDDEFDRFSAGALPPPSASAPMNFKRAAKPISVSDVQSSTKVDTISVDRGELFEYSVSTPVSVNRGKSAMVPILNGFPEYKKELIYNHTKYPEHPIAILRFKNSTGLTLEKGPITVIDDGQYAGEGILDYTPAGAETLVSFAIEMGIKIVQNTLQENVFHSLNIKEGYLIENYYNVSHTTYSLQNKNSKEKTVYIEHPITVGYTLYDTHKPEESTLDQHRFKITVGAGSKKEIKITERKLYYKKEYIRNTSYTSIEKYFSQKALDEKSMKVFKKVFEMINEVQAFNKSVDSLEKDKVKLQTKQEELRKNINVLSKSGEDSYKALAKDLIKNTEIYDSLDQQIASIKASILEKEKEIERTIQSISV
jgi:hypothetical protein